MVYNDLLMQFQADVLGVPVIRPKVAETTALGAAYAAGLAVGFWNDVEDLRANWGKDKEWTPTMDDATVARGVRAVEEGGHADVRLGGVTRRGDRRTAAHTARRSPHRDEEPSMEDEKHGDFAEGRGRRGAHEHHEGSFAEGQSEEHGHAEEGKHGDFAEGQEKDPDEGAPRGVVRRGSGQGPRPRRVAARASPAMRYSRP